MYVINTKEKISIKKCAASENISVSIKYLISWLTLLPPVVGWDIMGCESEPLPSYNKLSNCSYTVNFKCYVNIWVTLPPFLLTPILLPQP